MESQAREDARRRVKREIGVPSGQKDPNGPAVGSVVIDTRAGGRLAIVNDSRWGHSVLREPGTDAQMWPCPVVDMVPASPNEAARVRAIDYAMFPPNTITRILTESA